jgi:phosphatidylserine/phosphatidylglycerophosphate/cardiolipin synthase-like enzyme
MLGQPMDAKGPIKITTLTDGGQKPEAIAAELIAFIEAAKTTLDIALYDVRLPGEIGDRVAGSIKAAAARGVAVRIMYNADGFYEIPVPAPPSTRPELLAALGVPLKPIPGEPDLMHHKYMVRDGEATWSGSTNWTLDSWTREENLFLTTESPQLAANYAQNFEQLWSTERVEGSGNFDTMPITVGGSTVRAWFSPGRGEALAHRIAKSIGTAERRVRIASPVLTSGPILGTLAEVLAEKRVEVLGVCDWTQLHAVFGQWKMNPGSQWKMPLLADVLEGAEFTGKRSTPYAPGRVHDYMHAKVTVADDTSFIGSFNLSRSGEMNAENVIEIHDAAIADRMAAFIDGIRTAYPDVDPPAFAETAEARAAVPPPPRN